MTNAAESSSERTRPRSFHAAWALGLLSAVLTYGNHQLTKALQNMIEVNRNVMEINNENKKALAKQDERVDYWQKSNDEWRELYKGSVTQIAALDSRVEEQKKTFERITDEDDKHIASLYSDIAALQSETGIARRYEELNKGYELLQGAYESIAAIHSNCNHRECDRVRSDLEGSHENLQELLNEFNAEVKARRRAERANHEQHR